MMCVRASWHSSQDFAASAVDVLSSDDVMARLEARSDLDAVRAAMASLPAAQRELMASRTRTPPKFWRFRSAR
jgi:hypothetical protein